MENNLKEQIVEYINKQDQLIASMRFIENSITKFDSMNKYELNNLCFTITNLVDCMEEGKEIIEKSI